MSGVIYSHVCLLVWVSSHQTLFFLKAPCDKASNRAAEGDCTYTLRTRERRRARNKMSAKQKDRKINRNEEEYTHFGRTLHHMTTKECCGAFIFPPVSSFFPLLPFFLPKVEYSGRRN